MSKDYAGVLTSWTIFFILDHIHGLCVYTFLLKVIDKGFFPWVKSKN